MSARGGRTAEPTPKNVTEALARARRHARAAAAEAAAALRALVDAASLAATGESSEHTRLLAAATGLLDELRAWLETGDTTSADGVLVALAEALDAEIRRWEQRSRDDAEARAVLRAFLGLRELVWELGVRPPPGASGQDAKQGSRPRRTERPPREPAARSARVKRVHVEG